MTVPVYSIPLISGPQAFSVSLGGTLFKLQLLWRNAAGGGWFLDVANAENEPLIAGLPLRPGVNLLEQYAYLGIGKLRVMIDGMENRDPSFADMGAQLQLFWSA